MSCVLTGLLEGFLQDRRAWLQSGEGASHLDDSFFFFYRSASPSLWRCQVCTKAMPFTVCVIGARHLPPLPGNCKATETKTNLVAMLKTNAVISASNRIVIQWSCNECSEMVVSWNILWTRLEVLNRLFVKSVIADIICGGCAVYPILFMYSLGQCCFINEREIFVLLS